MPTEDALETINLSRVKSEDGDGYEKFSGDDHSDSSASDDNLKEVDLYSKVYLKEEN